MYYKGWAQGAEILGDMLIMFDLEWQNSASEQSAPAIMDWDPTPPVFKTSTWYDRGLEWPILQDDQTRAGELHLLWSITTVESLYC